MSAKTSGILIIIGGREEKDAEAKRSILAEVASHVRSDRSRLVVITAASQVPQALAADYTRVFQDLGVKHVDILDIRSREDAFREEAVAMVRQATAVFFTGGDQLRITSQASDSPTFQTLLHRFEHGMLVAGTSAGAAAMPDTMLVGGRDDQSYDQAMLSMAPGLGLIRDVVIDSHFAQRGRFGRLLAAVAQNPKNLGLGIDENTAVVVKGDQFRVLGSGAVYVCDGAQISYSSLSEEEYEGILGVHDVRLHVLRNGDCFVLTTRRPMLAGTESGMPAVGG